MIVAAQHKQFTLKEDGQIYFQPDSTNPLPGDVLAIVKKGESLLQPSVSLLEGRDLGGEDSTAVLDAVSTWLKAHIYTVLEPLFNLVGDENLAEPVKDIALKLFSHTGIVPRGDVDEAIAKLDADMRKTLRDKKVRLGPLLVFLPDLNKPAAVKLRAVLWSLFHDKVLPPSLPRDGAMSSVVDVTVANPDFYRAIGYPLYGPRAVRIDMLDRVINAVYDSAKEGKFQAQHKMAEWMGCPIADLYAILEAMGHRRIEKPAIAQEVEVALAETAELAEPQETQPANAEEPKAESEKVEQKKPDLDWFSLRRGKAHVARTERPPRARHESGQESKPQKPQFPKERYEPKGAKGANGANSQRKAGNDADGEKKFHKKKQRDRDNDRKAANNDPRVYTAAAATSDNPFAVLQNLKLK